MRCLTLALLTSSLLVGCADPAADSGLVDSPTASDNSAQPAAPGSEESASSSSSLPKTPATGNQVALSPANTAIKFVGNHTGDDPKPRSCSFSEFTGTAVVDGGLKSIEVAIKTPSIQTEFDNLTTHLKNADFFDVNQFPEAKFVSSSIETAADGKATITGDLTLLGKTHPVSFQATVDTSADLKLSADFEIDRTLWGMNYDPSKVEKMVEMSISVGQQ